MVDRLQVSAARVPKSLDVKLARILAQSDCRDFILADAKDADMAFGLSAPGRSPEYHGAEARFRTLAEYRQQMREIVQQGLVDIMLMSASSSELLTLQERLFDPSHVTPAIRANDTTDIWLAAGSGRYPSQPSRPFRSATIDHAQCGKVECAPHERQQGADLGLYSITLNNDTQLDAATLEAYKTFRLEAETQRVSALPGGFRSERADAAAGGCGAVYQRSHRAPAGRRDAACAPGVSEDRLPRARGDGSPLAV